MGKINVVLVDATGNKEQKVGLPDDIKCGIIMVKLVEKIKLPSVGPDGNPISYKFIHKVTGRQLLEAQTLGEAGIKDGDVLRLQPEITAGAVCGNCGNVENDGEAFCSKCGAPLGDGQAFCPKCGTPKISRQTNCGKCGAPLAEGQEFCAKCGQKVGVVLDQNVSNAINQFNQNVAVKKKPKKTWLVILSIVLVVGILGSIGYVGVLNAQKEELQERLMSTKWWSYDDDTKLYLDFSEDEVEYSGYFGYYLGTQEISTMDYEIVDGNTIKVRGREIEVELDDDSVVFRPSFVNTDSYSLWMD